jgi:RNA recognition motif-containing protein
VTNIYVGNLSFRATEDEIRQAFARFGEVSKVSIIVDRETGRSRGFAFVEMPSGDEAKAAVEALNQQEVAGRRISCNEARPREERPAGGGGYGGGGGGYGGGGGGGYGGGGGGRRERGGGGGGDSGGGGYGGGGYGGGGGGYGGNNSGGGGYGGGNGGGGGGGRRERY